MCSFYQDRLGTNIGKALKKETTVFLQVIVQRSHRGEYDHAVRMAGGVWVEVSTLEEMKAAINERTVMLYALGVADHLPQSLVSIGEMGALASRHGLPLFVDAAAERPDTPNHYLEQGATVVSYSGGKGLRGPQASGMLLGTDQRLLWDAFQHGAPHHGLGRPLKVSSGFPSVCLESILANDSFTSETLRVDAADCCWTLSCIIMLILLQ
jgi:seryl-tRNA(Sec) selenium transferase